MPDLPPVLRNAAKDVLGPAIAWWRYRGWQRRGCPIPPPHSVKRDLLRVYARDYGLRTLVETGTYNADTVRGVRRHFDRIISIELDPTLHARALRRCRRQKNAELLLGDSGQLIKDVVARLDAPALFWLDAHYSGPGTARHEIDTPILAELTTVLSAESSHVILIDDLREFAAHSPDYPQLELIEQLATQHGYVTAAALDILRLTPSVRRL